jgi:hypothetical protein
MRTPITILIAADMLLACPAAAMPVADFLAKAEALKAKGPLALFSSDLKLLKTEATGGFKVWHAQIAPAGRPPNACPPKGPQKMSSDDILAMLARVPAPQRASTSVADALTAGLNRRYPCHG